MRKQEVVSDRFLARRLERAEAVANARFVEARARVQPGSGAAWIDAGGCYAMYDGPRSPCTQTFGLGLFEEPTTGVMDKLESFFLDRGAPVLHEVSPLAGAPTLSLIGERGYRPLEFTSVMYLSLNQSPNQETPVAAVASEQIAVRLASAEERDLWVRLSTEGWQQNTDLFLDMALVIAANETTLLFLAELNGQPIATAAMSIHDGVALFAGASTLPEWRQRGAQRALIKSRLEHGARAECDLAMICAEPGGESQRNAERNGFRIAYTRLKWTLADR